ncbi:excalibur calcium-binding domain-containing protein [Homoserinibacter sp. GY 40078]|uniref:excalibur calcium-binding domain-containing protein n=1 Tax=Homoserinibacter sp. GY 40078 TaxID=2603275 RepID=UPI0011CAC635|nr:excalibur calcium-binding domain-containing protein [Homoserinibacter sp. GY 40078]TXK19581.1 excalibur calcium-binding domain-containing protein [Homoserinibacter sp. GY 40078]
MKRNAIALLGAVVLVLGPTLAGCSEVSAPISASLSSSVAKTYKNCTELNKKYPHGVGKKGAKDKVRGSTKPVTNFTVSTALYNANKKSDRDKDGVACEKR